MTWQNGGKEQISIKSKKRGTGKRRRIPQKYEVAVTGRCCFLRFKFQRNHDEGSENVAGRVEM